MAAIKAPAAITIAPMTWLRGDDDVTDLPRTIAEVFTSLTRANLRVDAILEPEPPADAPRSHTWSDLMGIVPATVIFRARKHGT